MRIGSTVLLKEQLCVQSYKWKTMRPLGNLQGVINSLEEYQCDEVSIIRPVRKNDSFKDFKQDIQILKSLKTMTPISFGGGIRSVDHLKLLSDLPIERLVISSAFLEKNMDLIILARDLFGPQAIKCLLPVNHQNDEVSIYHSSAGKFIPLSTIDTKFIDEFANEIVLFDTLHEGCSDQFDWSILSKIPFASQKLIISGGIGKQTFINARDKNIASVLIDNKVLHKEYLIRGYKNA